jgi:hypothetical protein
VNATEVLLIIVVLEVLKDGLLAWGLIRLIWAHTDVAPAPVGPGAGPVAPQSPVVVAVKPRFTGITATSFGGAGDANASAYGGMVNPDAAGVALPSRFSGTRPRVRVFYQGKTCDCDIVDVGPWNISDPYWTTNTRPQAESGTDNSGRRTNLAGIDLTPAAWAALGAANVGKAKVDWDFVNVLDASSAKPTPSPPPVAPGGIPAWITLGRTFNGLVWSGGAMPAQLVTWMDHISATFPDMAAYCQALKNEGARGWWAWCGFFVQAMLSYSNIRGPISAAGLKGDTTVADWAYVDAWRQWGTKVWDASDGDISNAQPRIGDVLVWAGAIHHVSFYDHPEPTTDTFASLGGDQGKPLRVCIEDISMSYCVAIRRPPVA